MAIVDTINSIKEHIEDAYGIVEEKGGTIPQNKNLENLSVSIGSISGGGEPSEYNTKIDGDYYTEGLILTNLITEIKFKNVKLPQIITMASFFNGLSGLKKIDMTYIDTSKCGNFQYAFQNLNNLEEIIMTNNTMTNYTSTLNLQQTFSSCSKLKEIDFKGCNLSNVNIMSYIFSGCSMLERIILDGTNLGKGGKLTNMSRAFQSCGNLKDSSFLKNITTSSVTDMSYMFHGCKMLDIDFELDTTNVTNMSYMFYDCMVEMPDKTMKLKCSNPKVTNMSYMFRRSVGYVTYHGDTKLDLSEFYTPSVTNMSYMFCNYGDKKLDLRSFNTSNVTNMGYMFNSCKFLEELYLDNFDFTKVTSQSSMFTDCGTKTTDKLTKVYVKDATAQNWILTKSNGKPSTWSTANIIIAGSAADDRNL